MTQTSTDTPGKLVFVLVEPARPENVGAAARAIKTMGFNELRLVGAAEPGPEAWWVAHESGEILDQAKRFDSLAAALEDVDFSVATGARRRLVRDRYLTPAQAAAAIRDKAGHVSRAALVFGRESSGLTSAEMALCDAASTIPMAVSQPSLNLAQAVMVYAWEMRQGQLTEAATSPAQADSFRVVRGQAHDLLAQLGFARDENIHQWLTERLADADSRSLGLLMTVMQRIRQRITE